MDDDEDAIINDDDSDSRDIHHEQLRGYIKIDNNSGYTHLNKNKGKSDDDL